MSANTRISKRRLDYQAAGFSIPFIELDFKLFDQHTVVTAVSQIQKDDSAAKDLVLDGVDMQLLEVAIDGNVVSDYKLSETSLTLFQVPDSFTLSIKTQLDPANNSSLEGLYKSSGTFCTQCEAEGFRKITYFLDRPDILTKYLVTIEADKAQYPYLLSNGNKIAHGDGDNGRHWVRWEDPYNKPCYLFALVAGDFDLLEDDFTTESGRQVALQLFVDKGNLDKGQHALDSLKKAMDWDEKTFGLEYDLDVYMIVAVDFFNMGAMENKGLNIFNSKYVLANSETATDEDYFHIESVIAHEYFHNWTGNRVTCRDWFQLSLKEGLTVFRDQQFSADMASRAINRINNVRVIREHQFAEDAGPMSHPIRPDVVMEMNNFYTVTVYNKGAEVISMLHRILGKEGFRRGMDLYFERFDGQAVTCEDFVDAMADANHRDLTVFKGWYSQSGTPRLTVNSDYDSQKRQLTIEFSQCTPATADQQQKQPLHIPVDLEILNHQGQAVPCFEQNQTHSLFHLTTQSQQLIIENVEQPAAINVLRDFSAPVKLQQAQSDTQLHHIMLYGTDPFSRWDAGQQLLNRHINNSLSQRQFSAESLKLLMESYGGLWQDDNLDKALLAEMLVLPSFETLAQLNDRIDVDGLLVLREQLQAHLATELQSQWLEGYHQHSSGAYQYNQTEVAKRRLKNVCLDYLLKSDAKKYSSMAEQQFNSADNMTDSLGVLKACQDHAPALFDKLMNQFEQRWQHDALVMDKWFALQAGATRTDSLSRLNLLMEHSGFSLRNPNRVRALIGTFAFYNPQGFHALDGSGYRWLTKQLMVLDEMNPQVASRLVTPLLGYRRLDETRQDLIEQQLIRLADRANLSNDLYEKITLSLNQPKH